MEPTLKEGQMILKSDYSKGTNPARGDIILFKAEKSSKLPWIRRVIGLPKEKVVIKEGIVYIVNQANPQGEKLNEPYLAPGTITEPDGEFLVPDGQYFVLADKRGASRDSRQIGCIPRENVIGKVTKIF
jgi:signal peptidase I